MIEDYSPRRLRSLRERALLSQREVERQTGISDATIAYLESGRHKPQSKTLRRLLFLYEMNIRSLEQFKLNQAAPEEKIEVPRPIRASEIPHTPSTSPTRTRLSTQGIPPVPLASRKW